MENEKVLKVFQKALKEGRNVEVTKLGKKPAIVSMEGVKSVRAGNAVISDTQKPEEPKQIVLMNNNGLREYIYTPNITEAIPQEFLGTGLGCAAW